MAAVFLEQCCEFRVKCGIGIFKSNHLRAVKIEFKNVSFRLTYMSNLKDLMDMGYLQRIKK